MAVSRFGDFGFRRVARLPYPFNCWAFGDVDRYIRSHDYDRAFEGYMRRLDVRCHGEQGVVEVCAGRLLLILFVHCRVISDRLYHDSYDDERHSSKGEFLLNVYRSLR